MAKEFHHKQDPDYLNRLPIIISNVKSFVGGTFHGLDKKHLQPYLGEFCYRFNRRGFTGQGFNRLLAACSSANTVTFDELVGVPT